MLFTIYANSGHDEKIIRNVTAGCLTMYIDFLKHAGNEVMIIRET